VHGCLPSHLIFFRRHSSHALVTLRRFCKGMLGASAAPSWTPKASSDSGLMEDWAGDLALSDGDANSSWDKSAVSSSDISGVLPEAVALDATAAFLVLLLARPERGGREAGRAVRAAAPSGAGTGISMLRIWTGGDGSEIPCCRALFRIDLLPVLVKFRTACSCLA
jgi:hypothetical protein